MLDQAHFGLTNYALGGDQVIKMLELGYYPITDVDFQGALQVKANCKKMGIPVKFYAFLIDWP
jgi:guanylate kinase